MEKEKKNGKRAKEQKKSWVMEEHDNVVSGYFVCITIICITLFYHTRLTFIKNTTHQDRYIYLQVVSKTIIIARIQEPIKYGLPTLFGALLSLNGESVPSGS